MECCTEAKASGPERTPWTLRVASFHVRSGTTTAIRADAMRA